MLDELKYAVAGACAEIKRTLGDVFGILSVAAFDPESRLIVMPEGVFDLDGNAVEAEGDAAAAATFAEIFKEKEDVFAAAIFDAPYATSFAQGRKPIPVFGAAHLCAFGGDIPVTRPLTRGEIDGGYRAALGRAVCDATKSTDVGAAMIAGHYPAVWAKDLPTVCRRAVLLEEVAKRAAAALMLSPGLAPLSRAIREAQD